MMLVHAIACFQNIAYPTDIKILNASNKRSEELIDILYDRIIHGSKTQEHIAKMHVLSICIFRKKLQRRS